MDHDEVHPKNPNYSISASRLREHRLAHNRSPEILDDSSDVDESDPRPGGFFTPMSVPTTPAATGTVMPMPNRQLQQQPSKFISSTPLNGPPRYPKGFRPPMAMTLDTLELSAIEASPSGLGMGVSGRQKFVQLSPTPIQEESKPVSSSPATNGSGIRNLSDSASFITASQSPVPPINSSPAPTTDDIANLVDTLKITEEDSEDSDDDIAVPIRPNPFKKKNRVYVVDSSDSDSEVQVLTERNSKSPTETEVLTLDDSEPSPIPFNRRPKSKFEYKVKESKAKAQSPDPSESDESSFEDSTKENRQRNQSESQSDDDEESDEEPLSPEALRRMEARTGTIPKPKPTAGAAKPSQVQGGTKFLSLDQLPSQSRERDATGGHGQEPKFSVPTSTIISKLLKIIESSPDPNSPLGPEDQLPKRLRADLYAHQVYGLRWLWWREGCMPGGGILADEMGLGKTVMVIALICRGLERGSQDFGQPAPSSRLVPSKSTLVVVPSSVLGQWEQEIKVKARGLSVYQYHGPNRARSPAVLSRNDIVLTTFKTLQSDMPKDDLFSSPLARIYWDRIVLDEGHTIRNPVTGTAVAACGLNAKHRWIVTGTPVHNKPGDMYSLVKFLRLSPFDDKSAWDHWIGIKKVMSKDGAQRLNTIGKALILRRTKVQVGLATAEAEARSKTSTNPDGTDENDLADALAQMAVSAPELPKIPPKHIEDVHVTLSPEEKKVYDYLFDYAKDFFTNFLKDKAAKEAEAQSVANGYNGSRKCGDKPKKQGEQFATLITLLLRLRQCTVLPFLISAMIEEDEDEGGEEDLNLSQKLEQDFITLRNPVFAENFESAKITRLLGDLEALRRTAAREARPMDKIVILSQWTSVLNIIGSHLSRQGFTFTSITGETKMCERTEIIARFNSNPKRPQIMLLSLMAGGVGLNLTGANIMFVMDLHWNPQNELQAHDRIHRFGQKKEVKIYRYLCQDSIDERVNGIQLEKKQLADELLDSAKKAKGPGLSLQDMHKLFGC